MLYAEIAEQPWWKNYYGFKQYEFVAFPSVGGGVKEGVFANVTIGGEYYEGKEY